MKKLQEIVILIKDLIKDPNFIIKHVLKKNAFTRNRKLPFDVMVVTILRLVKKSLQITCNLLSDFLKTKNPASKQAFSKARHLIAPEGFIEIHNKMIKSYYKNNNKGLWKDFRLIACDGSTLRLPSSKEIINYFGRCKTQQKVDNMPAMARISEFTDMTSGIVLNGKITPYNISEQTLAEGQLKELCDVMKSCNQKKLLFVYDRGYPSYEFFKQHLSLNADFIFRAPKNFNKIIKKLIKENQKDIILKMYEDLPLLRVIIFELSSGELEIIITSLIDQNNISRDDLLSVYNARWVAMEEGYKTQKISLELDNFSGKTKLVILQEFFSTLIIQNLIYMHCIEIEGFWIPNALPKYKLNRRVLFGSLRDLAFGTLLGMYSYFRFKSKFKKLAARNKIPIKPRRHFSRQKVGQAKRHKEYSRVC